MSIDTKQPTNMEEFLEGIWRAEPDVRHDARHVSDTGRHGLRRQRDVHGPCHRLRAGLLLPAGVDDPQSWCRRKYASPPTSSSSPPS